MGQLSVEPSSTVLLAKHHSAAERGIFGKGRLNRVPCEGEVDGRLVAVTRHRFAKISRRVVRPVRQEK